MTPRPDFCTSCPISAYTEGYTPLKLRPGSLLAVGEASGEDEIRSGEGFSGGSGRWLWNMLKLAGHPQSSVSTLNVIGCHPPGNIFPGDSKWKFTSPEVAQAGVAHCVEHHLHPGLEKASRSKLLAIGNKSLVQLTGKSGILTWRGSPLPLKGEHRVQVMPIIHPAALMRQAKFASTTVGDLRKKLTLPPEYYNLLPSLPDVQAFKARSFAFDFEWNAAGEITLCGLSDQFYRAMVVPFIPPYIDALREIFERAEELIGHNIIGADLSWIEKLGWKLRADLRIEDTMLKQHLCQPDLPHDLGFVSSVFTSKVFWKGKGWEEMDEEGEGDSAPGQQWRTWDREDALPRELGGYGGCYSHKEAFALYNARDTDAEFQINTPLTGMLKKWDLTSLYENVSRPAAFICRDISERGLRIDTSHLSEIRSVIEGKIEELEGRLPQGLAPYTREVSCNIPAPPGTHRAKMKICTGTRKAPHEAFSAIFSVPETSTPCGVCGRVLRAGKLTEAKVLKGTRPRRIIPYNSPSQVSEYVSQLKLREIIDRKTGNRTTGKQARGIWAKNHPEFATLGLLKQQVTLRNNFAKESLLGMERMFFNLKVHGTAEGRLSCSGKRRGVDLNIQNQPSAFRSIYIPEREDWGFVNIDISQGESWLTCWLAQDWERWEKLQSPSYDEHSELASQIFGREVNKSLAKGDPAIDALRQIGKKTNHASAYGMGYKKFFEVLSSEGYDQFTPSDAKDFLETWKKLNARTCAWQRETVEIVQRQGYLRNPFGRVRWFSSHDSGTQCLAFLPASTLADMMLRMMIAHYPSKYLQEIQANNTSVYRDLSPEWIMSIMVHDSLVFQGPWDTRQDQIERSTAIMTQPFEELGGFKFRVDTKASRKSWGDC